MERQKLRGRENNFSAILELESGKIFSIFKLGID